MSALLETAVRPAGAPRARDLLEALLSAAGDHAALLDSTATILAVNQAWMQYAVARGAQLEAIGVGANYFAAWREGSNDSEAIALSGIESVLRARTARFSCEYSCTAHGVAQWFRLNATAVRGGCAIVAHTQITRAESALRASEELYRILMANFPRGAVAVLDDALRFELVDGEWLAATGLRKEAMIGCTLAEAVPPELAAALEPHLSTALNGHSHSFELTYRKRMSEVHVASLASPRGLKVMAVVQDVTEHLAAQHESMEHRAALTRSQRQIRALAARLLTGQEEERRRIARELHDDLNQRIAVLAVALGAIRDQAREARQDFASDLDLLYRKTAAISDDVRRLTHNLHPALLEHVGLGAALRGLTEELSEQTGMHVELRVEEPLGPIPRTVALCLYRVTQEALRNVLQHAGVAEARVTLARSAGVLELTVADRGRGFDRDKLRVDGGLGLMSMEERVRLVDGYLELRTAPGDGTELVATVRLYD